MKIRNYFLSSFILAFLLGNVSLVKAQSAPVPERANYDLSEKYNDLKYQLKCALGELNKLQEENYYLKQDKTDLKSYNENIMKENFELKNIISNTKKDYLSVKDNYDNLLEQKNILQSKISSLEPNYISTEKQKAELKEKLAKLEDELANIQKEKLTLENSIKIRENQLAESLKLYEQKESEIINVKNTEIKQLKNKLAIHDKNIKDLTLNQKPVDFELNVKAIQLLKDDEQTEAFYYFNMAKAYQHDKAIDKAIENYKLAIQANPDLSAAYSQLGLIYAEKGDYKDSIELFKKYLSLSDNPEEEELIKQFINKMNTLVKK